MDKKNKGLVDDNEHGLILNESGTSVSFGWDAGEEDTTTENSVLGKDKESNISQSNAKEEKGAAS